jgi:phosphoglycolate phosphatase
MKIYGDKSPGLMAYDILSRNFDVKIKPVSARLTEVVLLRTFDPASGQRILDQNRVPVTINDSKFALHLTKKGIDKSTALRDAFRYLNLNPTEVAVVGDSETDLPMFEICGFSAAVGNAPEEVKSKASYACKKELGEGAVEAISHILSELRKN